LPIQHRRGGLGSPVGPGAGSQPGRRTRPQRPPGPDLGGGRPRL